MQQHRVLITAVGGNIGQGIVKALRATKRNFYIVGIDMEPLSAGFSLVESYYVTPRTGAPSFKVEIEKIIKKEMIEAIYVCSPTELEFFSNYKEEMENKNDMTIFVNPIEVVRVASDKLRTVDFLKGKNFDYPKTVIATDEGGLRELISLYGFPLIAKPRKGFTSKNVFIINSYEEIIASRTLVNDLIIQRYIPDSMSEYTASVVSGRDKKAKATIILHRILNQGTTYRTELFQEHMITKQIIDIANELGVVGVCNLQFKIFEGKVYVFEINPRFSGTVGIRYLYGFNDAEMVFDHFRLGLDIKQPQLKQGVVLRYWNEIYISGATFETLHSGKALHTRIHPFPVK